MAPGRGAAGARGAKRMPAAGRIGNSREAWLRLHNFELVLYEYDDPDGDDEGITFEAPGVTEFALTIKAASHKRPMFIKLSSFTLDELEALSSFFNRAVDKARPSVETLDELAQVALEEGNDSHIRNYRAVPQLHVRQRRKPEHGSGVPSGPDRPAPDDG